MLPSLHLPPSTYTRSLSAPQTLHMTCLFRTTLLTVALELPVLRNFLSAYEKYKGHLKLAYMSVKLNLKISGQYSRCSKRNKPNSLTSSAPSVSAVCLRQNSRFSPKLRKKRDDSQNENTPLLFKLNTLRVSYDDSQQIICLHIKFLSLVSSLKRSSTKWRLHTARISQQLPQIAPPFHPLPCLVLLALVPVSPIRFAGLCIVEEVLKQNSKNQTCFQTGRNPISVSNSGTRNIQARGRSPRFLHISRARTTVDYVFIRLGAFIKILDLESGRSLR